MVKKILISTIYSILIFFSISFLTLIFDLFLFTKDYCGKFQLGFPFEYYYQFPVDGNLNHGSSVENLFIHCFITWTVVTGIYLFIKRGK